MTDVFTHPDTWSGGSFEIALEFGPPSAECLRQALVSLWRHPTLQGCYLKYSLEPSEQNRVGPEEISLDGDGIVSVLRGIAELPNGQRVACCSDVVREEEGSDWLYFGVPMGALARAYPVGAFPFDDGSPLDWREIVSVWLRDIADAVYQTVPFRLGLVGCILGVPVYATDVAISGIPQVRYEGYLWPENGALQWYPPNQGALITAVESVAARLPSPPHPA